MRKYYSLFAVLSIAAIFLSGCVKIPQTSQEFRETVVNGAFGSEHQVLTTNVPFRTAIKRIKSKANSCLNYRVTMRRPGQMRIDEIYRSQIFLAEKKARFEIRMDMPQSAVDLPEGGMYQLVVDLEAVSRGKTKLSSYGRKDFVELIAKTVEGKKTDCPAKSFW